MTFFHRPLLSAFAGLALAVPAAAQRPSPAPAPEPAPAEATLDGPLVSTAPDTRPALPARTVWMNTSKPPTEARLAGRPVVVLVWNARSAPSLDTLPWFARLNRYFSRAGRGGGDAAFLLVHAPESDDPAETGPAVIAAALNAVEPPGLAGVPVLLDNDAAFYAALGSPAVPTLFVFGRDGRLVDTTVGRVGRYEARARAVGREIKDALTPPPPQARARRS